MTSTVAKQLAAAGHNLIITGQAGTGKTTLLKAIFQDLCVDKNIQICASTGIATLQFDHAVTLHSWCGI
jgi:DNA replication protein DnaC